MRPRGRGAPRAAQPAQARPAPLSLAEAVQRLADGDASARFGANAGSIQGAEAFNKVADLLAEAQPDGGSLFDAFNLTGDQSCFVAIVSLGRFGGLRRHVGSRVADEILKHLCERLYAQLPQMRLGRVGRTQIEILFPAGSMKEAEQLLDRARVELERPLRLDGQSFDLDVVIGFAPLDGGDEAVIENAAIALARAQSGHAKIAAFNEQERRDVAARVQLLRDLHHAFDADQLFLCYQPKLTPRTGVIDAAEGLIRWRHPVHGMIPPTRFIGLAEETGAIGELTRRVVRQAVTDQAVLAAAGHKLSLHVNLSGRLVTDADFTAWLLDAVKDVEPGAIGLEITETAVIEDPEHALANLQAFSDAGLPIAIDDYGAGLSSLSYLKQLPATELKIDRMFISGLTTSHRDPLLVRSTIDLAHALEMEVTAEGVEDAATLALLRTMGCDRIQGFFISRPLPLDELHDLLTKGVKVEQDFSFTQLLQRRAT